MKHGVTAGLPSEGSGSQTVALEGSLKSGGWHHLQIVRRSGSSVHLCFYGVPGGADAAGLGTAL